MNNANHTPSGSLLSPSNHFFTSKNKYLRFFCKANAAAQSCAVQRLTGPSSRSGRRLNVGEVDGLFLQANTSDRAFKRWFKQYLSGVCIVLSMAASTTVWAQMAQAVSTDAQQTAVTETAQLTYMSLNEVTAGQLLLKTDTAAQYSASLLLESRAHFTINGMLARVSLSQQFENTSQDWVEGIYAFPLPEDAAVDHLRVRIGERIIEGRIREKAEAKKIYQQAKQSGRKASLVEQERPNLFTNNVANIGPGEVVEVTIEYLQTVHYDQGEFQLRLPMTITPRYMPGQRLSDAEALSLNIDAGMGWAQATDEVPDASRISPYILPPPTVTADDEARGKTVPDLRNPIRITGELNMGMPLQDVDSQYHDILLDRDQSFYEFRLLNDWVAMDHDFVLRWRPVVGREPAAAIFSQAVDGEDYAMLMIMPPQAVGASSAVNLALPKEMIFVVDTSGSMGGVSIQQARFSLLYALEQLKPTDRFNIVEFNSDAKRFFPQPMVATAANLQLASEYVERLDAGGGTNIKSALESALWQDTDEAYLRQIIFITDGAVGNEEALFRLIHDDLDQGRLFTVGIGSAPNSYFMRKAAEFGRGSFTYIANIAETHERMRELFTKLESPLSSDIEIHWPDGATVESYPERIPDLYAGEPVLVAAKLDLLSGPIRVTGRTAEKDWQRELMVNQIGDHQGVATLWGRRKISHLLDEKAAGADENVIRSQVLDTALRHQILSPYTSFVAVEDVPSRPANEPMKKEAVPNAQPKGQAAQNYAYPQTATRARWSFMLAMVFLLLSLLRWNQRRVGLNYVASL